MSIAYRAQASAVTNGSSINVGVPAAVVSGDAMLLQVSWNNGSSNTITGGLTGWTQVGSDVVVAARTSRLYKKVAGSGDGGSTLSITFSGTGHVYAGLVAYSGVDSAIVDLSNVSSDGSSGTSHNAPSLTGTIANAWLVCLWTEKSSTETGWAAPGGLTERVNQLGSGTGALSGLIADSNGTVTSPTGTKTSTTTTATQASGWAVSLKPDTTPPPGPDPATVVQFRAESSIAGNTASTNITIPSTVQALDAMLLMVSWNNGSLNTLTPPNGWTQVGSDDVVGSRTTRLYKRVTQAHDAGTSVPLVFNVTAHIVAALVAYSNVDTTIIDQSARIDDANASGTNHTAPSVSSTTPSLMQVCFWTEKSTTETGWSAPADMVQRVNQLGSGTGALSVLVAEKATPTRPTLAETAVTATATQATSWTVTLVPFTGSRSSGVCTLSTAMSVTGKKIGVGRSATTAQASIDRRYIPRSGVLYGASPNQQPGTNATTMAMLTRYEGLAQRTLQLVRWFQASPQNAWFGAGSTPKAMVDAGYTLVFSTKLTPYTWAQVAAGQADTYLVARANEMAALGKPIFFCLHHEPDQEQPAADFKAMWQHAHSLMAPLAPNVIWVPIYSGYRANLQFWIDSYPGDAYVDWLGVDSYSADTINGGVPQPHTRMLDNFLSWLNTGGQVGSTIPILLGETGCHDSGTTTVVNNQPPSSVKAQWFYDDLAWMKSFTRLKAYLYWNGHDGADSLWVDSSSIALAAFQACAADPHMTGDVAVTSDAGPLAPTFLMTGDGTTVTNPIAPNAPVVSGPSGPSSTTDVTWTFTAASGTYECQLLFNGAVTVPWATCTSPVTLTLTNGNGLYQLQVRVTDSNGNRSAAGVSPIYTLNSVAPGDGGGGGGGGQGGGGGTPLPVGPYYIFRPPTVEEGPAAYEPPFNRLTLTRGVTVLKDVNGNYRQVRYPTQDDVNNATAAYLGGHEYVVDSTEAAALTTAGYGANLTGV